MLDTRTIERRMAAQCVSKKIVEVEGACDLILARFDQIDRELTLAEREVRKAEFLRVRGELGELIRQLLGLVCE